MIVENYIDIKFEAFDLQHSMTVKLYKLSKFSLNLWDLASLTPLETVSPWSLFSLWFLSTALALAIPFHHQCTTDTLKAHSSPRSLPQKPLQKSFSTQLSLTYSHAWLLFVLCVSVCVQNPLKNLDEEGFGHPPHAPSTQETAWYMFIIRKHSWIN